MLPRKRRPLLLLAFILQFLIPLLAAPRSEPSEVRLKERELKGLETESALTQPQTEAIHLLPRRSIVEDLKTRTRQLTQGHNASPDEESCTLTSDQTRRYYSQERKEWNVDNRFLSDVRDDLQRIVNCAQSGDSILFDTSKTIKPSGTVRIDKNITISAKPMDQLVRSGEIVKTESKVTFTCPDSEDLFIITSDSATVSNIAFKDCRNGGDVVALKPDCRKPNSENQIQFLHLEFTENFLNKGRRLLLANSSCIHLSMEDVLFSDNICDSEDCVLVAKWTSLHNIRIVRNRRSHSTDYDVLRYYGYDYDLPLPFAFFTVPHLSKTSASNIYASENKIRLFSVFNCSFYISNSYFENNEIDAPFAEDEATAGGVVLLANHSSVSVVGSTFLNNSAQADGGAILMYSPVYCQISNSAFSGNSAGLFGGAMSFHKYVTCSISNSNFSNNLATHDGGALYFSDASKCEILSTVFENNSAYSGGAVHIFNSENFRISNTTFASNSVEEFGGALSVHQNKAFNVSNSRFLKNSAGRYGGAVDLWVSNHSKIDTTNFSMNAARWGGALHLFDSNHSRVLNSTFVNNTAEDDGGALYLFQVESSFMKKTNFTRNTGSNGGACSGLEVSLDVEECSLKSNKAHKYGGALYFVSMNVTLKNIEIAWNNASMNGGGIFATDYTNTTLDDSRIISNYAGGRGGGVGVDRNSSLLCQSCTFRKNKAETGAGLFVGADNKRLIVAQLENSNFNSNVADMYGGGLDLFLPLDREEQCDKFNRVCPRVLLLNTDLVNNIAGVAGAAVMTTDKENVLVSCTNTGNHSKPISTTKELVMLENNFELTMLNQTNECSSWIDNQVENKENGTAVAFYGRYLNLSIENSTTVSIARESASQYSLENVRKGYPLPEITVQVVDAYGKDAALTYPNPIVLFWQSSEASFDRVYSAIIEEGQGKFSAEDIKTNSQPGQYSLQIFSHNPAVLPASVEAEITECPIGEEMTQDGSLCQACTVLEYNFDPSQPQACTSCDENANCTGRFIAPKEGNWHSHPCHSKVRPCLIEEACRYSLRQRKLHRFTQNFLSCDRANDELEHYGDILCNKGYKGPLCGSCDDSYGLSFGYKCSRCSHPTEAVSTLLLVTLYVTAVAAITIKGSLPSTPKSANACPSQSRKTKQKNHTGGESTDTVVSMKGNNDIPSEELQYSEEPSLNTSSPQKVLAQGNHRELTKWRTTEIFKIMLNFLQTIGIAALINVSWSKQMVSMFKATDSIGVLTSPALANPVDCLLGSSSAQAKSIWRTVVGVFVPSIVLGFFTGLWGVISFRKAKGYTHFRKRALLSTIAVIYISYLGLTKLAAKVFYCVKVYDEKSLINLNSTTLVWAADTSIECYKGHHLVLVSIAVPILVIVTACFPLGVGGVLLLNRDQYQQKINWTFETMGFLYRAFQEKFVFWECLIMLRKALLSVIVVFAYQLGPQSQGLLACLVLLCFLYLHLTCRPYRQEFLRLNHLESASLLVCCTTFLVGQFFETGRSTDMVKDSLAIFLIVMNTTFFVFVAVALVVSGGEHLRIVWQEHKKIPCDQPPSWLPLKEKITNKIKQWRKLED